MGVMIGQSQSVKSAHENGGRVSGLSRTHLGSGGLLAALALVTLLCVIGFLVTNSVEGSERDSAISILLIMSGLIAAKIMSGQRPVVESLKGLYLGPWMGIGFAVGYGLGSLRQVTEHAELPAALDPSLVIMGALVSLVGLTACTVAYRLSGASGAGLGRWYTRLSGSGPMEASAAAMWSLLAIGFAGNILQIATGRFGYLGDARAALTETSSLPFLGDRMASFAALGVLVASWRWSKHRTAATAVQAIALTLGLVALGLLTGMKEEALGVVLAAAFGSLSRTGARVLPWCLVLLLAALLVTPIVNNFRSQANLGDGSRAPLEQMIGALSPAAIQSTLSEVNWGDVADQLSARTARPSEVAVIIQGTPDRIPYAPVSELVAAPFLSFVPRSLWPEKPVLADGYSLQRQYYGVSGVYSSAGVPPYADLYRHGGILVVVIGMAVMGFLLRAFDCRFSLASSSPTVLFLPYLLLIPVFKQENPMSAWLMTLFSTVVVAVVATRITRGLSGSLAEDPPAESLREQKRVSKL